MAYNYDLFISYERTRWGNWVRSHLCVFLDKYLEGELGRKPRIFVDDNIETGETWPQRLVEAVACSKSMIGVWSPSYFDSVWCRYECLTMLARGREAGGRRLLLPVVVSDGHGFPDYAQAIQWVDCQDYVFEGKGFEDSPDYFEFQRLMKNKAADVKAAIEQAPRWRRNWLDAHTFELPTAPNPESNCLPTRRIWSW